MVKMTNVKYKDHKNTKPLTSFHEALPKKQCTSCAERRIVAGQAYTRFECAICAEIGRHHNTAIPKVCRKCANKLNVCERCGIILEEQGGG
jgi:ribosomal protein S27E